MDIFMKTLKNMMAKKSPIKEEVSVKPAIENAKTAIGEQIKKQENRPLLKGETDDAEWLARAGESETVEDIFATTDGLMREEFDPSKWKFFIAGAAAIPLLNIFADDEGGMKAATAGISAEGLKVLAKSKVSKVVMDSYKGTAKTVQKMYREMIEIENGMEVTVKYRDKINLMVEDNLDSTIDEKSTRYGVGGGFDCGDDS